jgi:GAF domain-containing protein
MTAAGTPGEPIRAAMTELTQHFAQNIVDLEELLGTVAAAAVALLPGVDCADVLLIDGDDFRSIAPTAPVVAELDVAQQRLREGPCLQAAVADSMIHCPDLSAEPRFPRFAPAAVDAGVHSMLSFQLYIHQDRGAGALNLCGHTPRVFTFEEQAIGAMLATHAAIALLAANKQHQFESALASRDLIGQAKGILMERFHLDAVAAFRLITRYSQDTNTPVHNVAQRIVDTQDVR